MAEKPKIQSSGAKTFESEKEKDDMTLLKRDGANFLLPQSEIKQLRQQGALSVEEEETIDFQAQDRRAKIRESLGSQARANALGESGRQQLQSSQASIQADLERLTPLLTGSQTLPEFLDVIKQATPEQQDALINQAEQQVPGAKSFLQNMIFGSVFPEGADVRTGSVPIVPAATAISLVPGIVKVPGLIKGFSGKTKWVLGVLGIGGAGAIGNAFTAGRVRELESDLSDMEKAQSEVLKFAANGGDPVESMKLLEQMYTEQIKLSGDLHAALGSDPLARIRNKDLEESVAASLISNIRKRQALTQYMQTGNKDALLALSGESLTDTQTQ